MGGRELRERKRTYIKVVEVRKRKREKERERKHDCKHTHFTKNKILDF